MLLRLLTLSLPFALGSSLLAENWPQWRGPRLDGTSQDTGFPTTADQNVTWKVELPGSCPLYTSDAAADLTRVDSGGRPLLHKTNKIQYKVQKTKQKKKKKNIRR